MTCGSGDPPSAPRQLRGGQGGGSCAPRGGPGRSPAEIEPEKVTSSTMSSSSMQSRIAAMDGVPKAGSSPCAPPGGGLCRCKA
mmetsp:Transcript_29065/g.73170  ORF Transcript_29065/g.73170 Transcript_29065/m.73170 type:complete len:83 (-) Transcript_29065:520-768(-)